MTPPSTTIIVMEKSELEAALGEVVTTLAAEFAKVIAAGTDERLKDIEKAQGRLSRQLTPSGRDRKRPVHHLGQTYVIPENLVAAVQAFNHMDGEVFPESDEGVDTWQGAVYGCGH